MDAAAPRETPSDDTTPAVRPDDIVAVRLGPGANCSSIGSALDLLFLSAVAGGALLATIAAAFPLPARTRQEPPAPQPDAEEEAGTTEETHAGPT
jgi:hypothetical protein